MASAEPGMEAKASGMARTRSTTESWAVEPSSVLLVFYYNISNKKMQHKFIILSNFNNYIVSIVDEKTMSYLKTNM